MAQSTDIRAPRAARLLTETQVKNARAAAKPLKLSEPGGLYLLVKPTGAKLWRYRFQFMGREGLLALGRYPEVGLADARKKLRAARTLVAQGVNPVHQRKQAESDRRINTFEAVAASWQARSRALLRDSTAKQRKRELDKYLLPKLGAQTITAITRPQLTALLNSVEAGNAQTRNHEPAPETAKNLRSHLSAIFEHAIDIGAATSNPTPPRRILKPRRSTHHAALPEARLAAFLSSLDRARLDPRTRIAMLLVMLTACRKNEVTSACWDEFDLEAQAWTIPAARMKAKQDHWVPLSRQAIHLIAELRALTPTERKHLFPNRVDPLRPMADRSLNAVLERLGFGGQSTPHGMRSLFSTHFNRSGANAEVIERCLAHAPIDKIRAAYNRHQYKEERRSMLQEWANYLDSLRSSAGSALT